MSRAVDVLNRLKPPYSDAQLFHESGVATDWRDRLPGRLLARCGIWRKRFVRGRNAGSPAGTAALLLARDALIDQVPQLNTVGERMASAIEDALREALPAGTLVAVDIGAIPDIVPGNTTKERAVTVGIKLRNDKWYEATFDITLPKNWVRSELILAGFSKPTLCRRRNRARHGGASGFPRDFSSCRAAGGTAVDAALGLADRRFAGAVYCGESAGSCESRDRPRDNWSHAGHRKTARFIRGPLCQQRSLENLRQFDTAHDFIIERRNDTLELRLPPES